MRSTLRLIGVMALAVVLTFAVWAWRSRGSARSTHAPLEERIVPVLTNAVDYAKNHFTGGIGAAMSTDRATGLPSIAAVKADSPADRAGLRAGDLIVSVNGSATAGRLLAQVVEGIRGFSGGRVTLTVQRRGSTNFECVIQRRSWDGLRGLNYSPYE